MLSSMDSQDPEVENGYQEFDKQDSSGRGIEPLDLSSIANAELTLLDTKAKQKEAVEYSRNETLDLKEFAQSIIERGSSPRDSEGTGGQVERQQRQEGQIIVGLMILKIISVTSPVLTDDSSISLYFRNMNLKIGEDNLVIEGETGDKRIVINQEVELVIDDSLPDIMLSLANMQGTELATSIVTIREAVEKPIVRLGRVEAQRRWQTELFKDEEFIGTVDLNAKFQFVLKSAIEVQLGTYATSRMLAVEKLSHKLIHMQTQAMAEKPMGTLFFKFQKIYQEGPLILHQWEDIPFKHQVRCMYKGNLLKSKLVAPSMFRVIEFKNLYSVKVSDTNEPISFSFARVFEASGARAEAGSAMINVSRLFFSKQTEVKIGLYRNGIHTATLILTCFFQPDLGCLRQNTSFTEVSRGNDSKKLVMTVELGEISLSSVRSKSQQRSISQLAQPQNTELEDSSMFSFGKGTNGEESQDTGLLPPIRQERNKSKIELITGEEAVDEILFSPRDLIGDGEASPAPEEIFAELREFQQLIRSRIAYYISMNPDIWCRKLSSGTSIQIDGFESEHEQGQPLVFRYNTLRSSMVQMKEQEKLNIEGDVVQACLFDEMAFAFAQHKVVYKARLERKIVEMVEDQKEVIVKGRKKKKKGKGKGQEEALPDTGISSSANGPIFNFSIPPFNAGQQIQGKWKGGQKGSLMVVDNQDAGDDFGDLEISHSQLVKSIEANHPRDPLTKKTFSVCERISILGFYSEILDVCRCSKISWFCSKIRRVCRKRCLGRRKERFVKPKSLVDLPDTSESSSNEEHNVTPVSQSLNHGSVLYLQTMKALILMFGILSILNIPVYMLYQDAGTNYQLSQFSDLFALFSFGMMGSTVETCDWATQQLIGLSPSHLDFKCPEQHYISKLSNVGWLQIRDISANRIATGEAICHQILNPGTPSLDFYLEKEKEGAAGYKMTEEKKQLISSIKQKQTKFNIHTECDIDTLWTDHDSKSAFISKFEETCTHKQECELSITDFSDHVSEECLDKVLNSATLSKDILFVMECSSDNLELPILNTKAQKETVCIFLVIWNIFSIIVVFHTFSRLKKLNEEYLFVMDNETVQMEDFAIQIKYLKLQRHCQDPRIIQMKVWLHFRQILEPLATKHNLMEILDVNLATCSEPYYKELMRMQAIQSQINLIKKNVCARMYDEEQMTKKREELDKLQERFNKIKVKYMNLTRQIIYDPEQPEVKLPVPTKLTPTPTSHILYCFVVFKHCETKDTVLEFFQESQSFLATITSLCKRKKNRKSLNYLFGERLSVKEAASPDEIQWNNFSVTLHHLHSRFLVVILISVGFFIFCLLFIMYSSAITFAFEERLPKFDCSEIIVSKEQAYADEISEQRNGFMKCWCDNEVSAQGKSIFNVTFNDIDPVEIDHTNYCLRYHIIEISALVIKLIIDASPVLLIEVVRFLFAKLSKYQSQLVKSKEQISTFNKIFIQEFTTVAVILLIQSFDQAGISDFLRGVKSPKDMASQEVYKGFESKWYNGQGEKLGYFILASGFISCLGQLLKAVAVFYRRLKDRRFKSSLKKNPDDSDDDAPNTKQKIQFDLNSLYTGPEFSGEKAFARMMTMLFVVLTFSSGMPVLYVVGFIYFLGMFFIHKFLLVKFFKKSSALSRTIWLHAQRYLISAILLHLFCGLFMMTNPDVISINTAGDDRTHFLSWQEAIHSWDESSNTFLRFLNTRIQNSYQLLFVMWAVGFVCIYYLGYYVLFVVRLVFMIISFIFSSIKNCFKTLCRKGLIGGIKHIMASQQQDDSQMIIQDHFSQRSLEKLGSAISRKYNITIVKGEEEESVERSNPPIHEASKNSDIEQLNHSIRQSVIQMNFEEDEANSQPFQEYMDKIKTLQMLREQLMAEIRKKRFARPDFSDNLLNELNPESLGMFHQRAVTELRAYRNYFHWDEPLAEGPASLTGKDQHHVVFKELCYVNKMTREQVLDFEFILEKRIYDIEDMIDHHFGLIKDFLEETTKAWLIKREEEKRKKGGVELNFQQEIILRQQQQEMLMNHPELQFEDEKIYTYAKKCEKLTRYFSELIQADKDRPANRGCVQTICRMKGSESQSYYTLDSEGQKVARRLYFMLKKEEVQLRELKQRAQKQMALLRNSKP